MHAGAAGCVLLAAWPALHPFTLGPSAAALPWLAGWTCTLLLFGVAAARGARFPWAIFLAGTPVAAWAGLAHGLTADLLCLAAAWLLIALAAGIACDPVVSGRVRGGFLLAAVLGAAAGLAQYFGLAQALAPWVSAAPPGQAYGNLRQPNQFATMCSLGIALLLFTPPRLETRTSFAVVALLAAGSAASVSRTGILQGLVLLLLAIAWGGADRARRVRLCLTAGGAYLASALLLPFLLEASTGAVPARTLWARLGGGEACSSRLTLWGNVLHLVAAKPLSGWGWGELDWAHYSTLYPGPRFCDILDNAHNLPLHLAVELGLPAAVLTTCGAAVWVLRRRPWQEQQPQRQLAWSVLVLIAVHSLLEYPLWYAPFQLAFGLALGWLSATPPLTQRPSMVRPAAAFALAASVTAYVTWDYLRVSQLYVPAHERLAAWKLDPIRHARATWLFTDHVRFAELTLTPLTGANANELHALATAMLHYSPEPAVVQRVIESSLLLRRDQEAVWHMLRFRAAFPREYAEWRARGPQQAGHGPSGRTRPHAPADRTGRP